MTAFEDSIDVLAKIALALVVGFAPAAQSSEPAWGTSLVDTDGGLISGTDIVGASFFIGATQTTLTLQLNGPVDLWQSSPDTGFTQIFLSVDRASVGNNRSGPEGSSDIQFIHDVPNQKFIWQSSSGSGEADVASFVSVSGNQYTLTFPTALFLQLANGESVQWGLVTSSAQTAATFDQGTFGGGYTAGTETFVVGHGFIYGGVSILVATTSVSSNFNPSASGQMVVFTAFVSSPGPTPTGTVTFLDGATPLCSAVVLAAGEGSCLTDALSAGTHSITVAYSGDGNYPPGSSQPLSQVVQGVSTRVLTVTKIGGSGTVISDPPGIDCGADCNEPYASNTSVTLTATPAPGSDFLGWTGACSGVSPCYVDVSGATGVSANFALHLDVDGDGHVDALTDGVILVRYMLGVRGPALSAGATGVDATRTAAQIETYLKSIMPY